MGSEYPVDHVTIHWVIFDHNDGQRRIHNCSSFACTVRTGDMRQGSKSCWYRTLTFATSIARWKNIFQDREVCLFTPPCDSTSSVFILWSYMLDRCIRTIHGPVCTGSHTYCCCFLSGTRQSE